MDVTNNVCWLPAQNTSRTSHFGSAGHQFRRAHSNIANVMQSQAIKVNSLDSFFVLRSAFGFSVSRANDWCWMWQWQCTSQSPVPFCCASHNNNDNYCGPYLITHTDNVVNEDGNCCKMTQYHQHYNHHFGVYFAGERMLIKMAHRWQQKSQISRTENLRCLNFLRQLRIWILMCHCLWRVFVCDVLLLVQCSRFAYAFLSHTTNFPSVGPRSGGRPRDFHFFFFRENTLPGEEFYAIVPHTHNCDGDSEELVCLNENDEES